MNYRIATLLPVWLLWASADAGTEASLSPSDKQKAEENAMLRKEWESWNAPFKPFRLIGNIYYVGPSGISSFLITTPEGHLLLDTGFDTQQAERGQFGK